MNRKFITLTTGLILPIISSCAPTISNFNSYQKQLLPKTSFMPDPDIVEGKPARVVVFDLDISDNNQAAKESDLGNSIAINIENVITEDRLATIIDRKAAKKLKNEIALAEANKTGSYNGPQIAEFAVSGSISNAGFSKKYISESVIVDPKTRERSFIPPQFRYTGEVAGNIKIYELPSMTVIQNLSFSGRKTRSENVQSDNNIRIGNALEFGGQKAKGIDRDDALIRSAGKVAIELIDDEIKNVFAQRGYILEKRTKDKKSIFKISLGSVDGIKQGDKFEVIGQFENENAVTGKSEIERRIIATGVVADKIDPKTSWVIIDDKEDVNSIRLGDTVKLKYKKGFFKKTSQFISNADWTPDQSILPINFN